MTTSDQVLAVARGQIGNVEDGNGCQKYGSYYGMNCVAWCAEFQYWIFNQAGAGNLICKSAYCPTFYQWFVNNGRAGMQPRPGAVVFFDWKDGGDRLDHVGIVEAVNGDGSITTIEGNTGSPGQVARRRRTAYNVGGYGYPAYGDASPTAPAAPPGTGSGGLPGLQFGMTSDSVAHLQAFCNAYNWQPELPLLPVTGFYGPMTRNVIRGAQAQMGVTGPDADGAIVGPRTNAALSARGYRG